MLVSCWQVGAWQVGPGRFRWKEASLVDAHVLPAPSGEPHDVTYIVIEGDQKGIYKNFTEMEAARDAPMKQNAYSYRAGWFWCEEDAKNWVQAVAVCRVLVVLLEVHALYKL